MIETLGMWGGRVPECEPRRTDREARDFSCVWAGKYRRSRGPSKLRQAATAESYEECAAGHGYSGKGPTCLCKVLCGAESGPIANQSLLRCISSIPGSQSTFALLSSSSRPFAKSTISGLPTQSAFCPPQHPTTVPILFHPGRCRGSADIQTSKLPGSRMAESER